mgnify:CR=1 FL=1
MWQDYVLAVGAFMLSIALIPTLRSKQKPALFTSVLTGGILCVFAVTYASLGLWLAVISQFIGAAAWFLLAWQKHKQS